MFSTTLLWFQSRGIQLSLLSGNLYFPRFTSSPLLLDLSGMCFFFPFSITNPSALSLVLWFPVFVAWSECLLPLANTASVCSCHNTAPLLFSLSLLPFDYPFLKILFPSTAFFQFTEIPFNPTWSVKLNSWATTQLCGALHSFHLNVSLLMLSFSKSQG